MANYNPDTSGLKQPKWINTPTRAIRVPDVFADELLAIAHRLDQGDVIEKPANSNGNHQAVGELLSDQSRQQIIDILLAATKMKAGNGGAIKLEITKALTLLGVDVKLTQKGSR
ncbi:MAG: hypothetical protein P5702_06905 [Limnospira sp. PMC 1291.21]|nr:MULTISPECIES: hypothetical protein [Limnospira]EKD08303.1 hypothetical protein SPLC1_S260760 [Arthrospira platensis C1]MDC0840049.1 hypothetical protein [Limnoraphis robusta]MDY7052875.1 hypothetical protein [Limnospira fusiformis LS22]QJB25143.1 hypothetical protein HFV01_04210 [Limnospira fusiformis SAG 85.79]EDZ93763.1 hypothetical protein AmaxDRAFT_3538 [Limnospira maxima CS-328]